MGFRAAGEAERRGAVVKRGAAGVVKQGAVGVVKRAAAGVGAEPRRVVVALMESPVFLKITKQNVTYEFYHI